MPGVVIVGASLAGATVALTLRAVGFTGSIELIGAEPQLPYERPGLSKEYLLGEVGFDKMLVRPAEEYSSLDIALRLGTVASSMSVAERTVSLQDGTTIPYDELVVATGSRNVRPPIPGIDLDGVLQLRTVADADALRAAVAAGARRAVTVGMGFIGTEIASSLRGLGLEVTAVDALPGPLWAQLGPEPSGWVRGWHEAHGVEVVAGVGVARLVGGGRVSAVELADGRVISADLVVVGVGARPETAWLAGSGVPLAADGGVLVGADGSCGPAAPGVWAAGDCAAVLGVDGHRRLEHWSAALAQGQVVAHALAGLAAPAVDAGSFFSQQYDKYLQYAGRHTDLARLVVRGAAEATPVGFYVEPDGRVSAVVTVNNGRELRRARGLLGRVVAESVLVDPAVDLRKV